MHRLISHWAMGMQQQAERSDQDRSRSCSDDAVCRLKDFAKCPV
jgi:hypothetical protein